MEVIYAYTRKQAIADGVLIDVTERAREAGFRVPVALTGAAWAECVAVPHGLEGEQDETGRLWDVLWMCRMYASRRLADPEFLFHLLVKRGAGRPETVMLKAASGPDDSGEPCVTIMLPDED
jgi:hypothetical protein